MHSRGCQMRQSRRTSLIFVTSELISVAGMDNTADSMRELALRISLEEENKRKTDAVETHERSIIVIGSKGVVSNYNFNFSSSPVDQKSYVQVKSANEHVGDGKTTMIHRFLEKEETPKPTVAMDYSFGRKAGKSLVKDVVHVWEIGPLTSSLLSAAMNGSGLTHSPIHTTLLMMLDLSKPEILWTTLEECLSVARSAIKMSFDLKTTQAMIDQRKHERQTRNERVLEERIDDRPFPMKLCIVGGRYDEFKEFDFNKKELIGRTLRAVAHSLGAGLQYHSYRDATLVRRTKEMLSHYGFGAQPMRTNCTDYEKPLLIPSGTDSYSHIGLELPRGRSTIVLDTIKQTYVAHISQASNEEDRAQDLEDPTNDPHFREPIIDRLRSQREEEIGVLLQEMLEGRALKIPIPEPM